MANKHAMVKVSAKAAAITHAAMHPEIWPLLHDRYQWPIKIVSVLKQSPSPLLADALIASVTERTELEPIGQPYLRDLISALRAGGAPIRSVRGVGYWWVSSD